MQGQVAVAEHYHGLLDGFVLDRADAATTDALALPCLATATLMRDDADKERLAREVLDFAGQLARRGVR